MKRPRIVRTVGRIVTVSILGRGKIEFGSHALQQMQIRGVSQAEVLKALRRPTATGLPTQPGRKRVRKNVGNIKAIDVVYEELDDRLRIITVIVKARTVRRIRKRGK